MKQTNINKAAATVYARICKNNGARQLLSEAWTDRDGKACACDGYRAIRLDFMPDVQHDTLQGDRIDLNRVYPKAEQLVKLAAPAANAAAALAEAKKQAKARKEKFDYVVFNEIVFNADYMRDMLQVFPANADWYGTAGKDGKVSKVGALVIKAAYGDAILLPVRYNDNTEKLFHLPTAEAEQPEQEQPEQVQEAAAPVQPEQETKQEAEQVKPETEQPEQAEAAPNYADYQSALGASFLGLALEIRLNKEIGRVQIFVRKPQYVEAVIAAGFWYSKAQGSYNKRLNYKAYKAAVELARRIEKAYLSRSAA